MKTGIVGLILVLIAGFMASCGGDDEGSIYELAVQNKTSVDIVVVVYGTSTTNALNKAQKRTFQVSPNQTGDVSLGAEGPYRAAIAGVGSSHALEYTHYFDHNDPYTWNIVYDGVISGPGGAGDLQ